MLAPRPAGECSRFGGSNRRGLDVQGTDCRLPDGKVALVEPDWVGKPAGFTFPFATRAKFVQAIEAGGVAAMEVLARDLKALGLYAARSLSCEGIEYELIEHQLTPEQVRTYDAYAGAFQVIQ